jgi:hypothetical protein
MVAAGFPNDRNGRRRDDSRPPNRDNLEDEPQSQKREWWTRQPRDGTRAFRSAKELIDGPCSIHPQELHKLQRASRGEKPLRGRNSTTTRKHSSRASRPQRATSPSSANKTGGRHPGTAKGTRRRRPVPRSPREDLHDTRRQAFQQAAETSHQTSFSSNLRAPRRSRVPAWIRDKNYFLSGGPPASHPPTRTRRTSDRCQNRKL